MAEKRPTKLLTPKQKAEELGVGEAKLRELARKGVVQAIKLGHRTVRYYPLDVEGLASSGGR